MKQINEMINIDPAARQMAKSFMDQMVATDHSMLTLMGLVESLYDDLGESPEAVRGATVALHYLVQLVNFCEEAGREDLVLEGVSEIMVLFGADERVVLADKVLTQTKVQP